MAIEELTQLLTQERVARQELWAQHQQLLAEVELLRNEAIRKDAELRVAGSALVHIHNGHQVQDLVEVNIALEEQVKSLKHMVQMMQQQQYAAQSKRDKPRAKRTQSASAKQGADPVAEPYEVVLGCMSAAENDPITMRNSVIDLKFELQSLKDAVKEKEEQDRIFHEAVVQREHEASFDDSTAMTGTLLETLKTEKMSLSVVVSPTVSPTAPKTDYEYFKTLALIRGGYWLHAEDKIKALKEKLAEERKQSAALRKELTDVEDDKLRLSEHSAQSNLLEQQLCEREKELSQTSKELELLRQRHQDESLQHKDATREAVQPAKAANAKKGLERAAALWRRAQAADDLSVPERSVTFLCP